MKRRYDTGPAFHLPHKPLDNIKVLCRYGNVHTRRAYSTITRVPFIAVRECDDFEMKIAVRYHNVNRVLRWNSRDGYHILIRPEEMVR